MRTLFADDFAGVSDSRESLQKLIGVVCSYYNRWRMKANVSRSVDLGRAYRQGV